MFQIQRALGFLCNSGRPQGGQEECRLEVNKVVSQKTGWPIPATSLKQQVFTLKRLALQNIPNQKCRYLEVAGVCFASPPTPSSCQLPPLDLRSSKTKTKRRSRRKSKAVKAVTLKASEAWVSVSLRMSWVWVKIKPPGDSKF